MSTNPSARYPIFIVWAGFVLTMFILAGGVKGIDPFHMTENVISVDSPMKYIIYYLVLAIFILLTFTLGRRGACHTICWMSPFMTAGYSLGRMLKIPQLRIKADRLKCVDCGACNKKCPMSIEVSSGVKDGLIKNSECILCGECVDGCNKKALCYSIVCVKRQLASEKQGNIFLQSNRTRYKIFYKKMIMP
jgi:polyferredoxin